MLMKNNLNKFLLLLFLICFMAGSVSAGLTSGKLIDDTTGLPSSGSFYSAGGQGYTDGAGGNNDYKIELCSDDAVTDLSGKSATITVGSNLLSNIGAYIPNGPLLMFIKSLCSSDGVNKDEFLSRVS